MYHPSQDHFMVNKITLETYHSLFNEYRAKFSIENVKLLSRKDLGLLRRENILTAALN